MIESLGEQSKATERPNKSLTSFQDKNQAAETMGKGKQPETKKKKALKHKKDTFPIKH